MTYRKLSLNIRTDQAIGSKLGHLVGTESSGTAERTIPAIETDHRDRWLGKISRL